MLLDQRQRKYSPGSHQKHENMEAVRDVCRVYEGKAKIIGDQRQHLLFCHEDLMKYGKDFAKCDILDAFKLRFVYRHEWPTRESVIPGFDFSEITFLFYKCF